MAVDRDGVVRGSVVGRVDSELITRSESAFVSAACMPPQVPLCEDNLVQPSSVVMSSPMELELELETVLSNPTPCDSSSAWIYQPQSISNVQAAAYAVEWDNSDRMIREC